MKRDRILEEMEWAEKKIDLIRKRIKYLFQKNNIKFKEYSGGHSLCFYYFKDSHYKVRIIYDDNMGLFYLGFIDNFLDKKIKISINIEKLNKSIDDFFYKNIFKKLQS